MSIANKARQMSDGIFFTFLFGSLEVLLVHFLCSCRTCSIVQYNINTFEWRRRPFHLVRLENFWFFCRLLHDYLVTQINRNWFDVWYCLLWDITKRQFLGCRFVGILVTFPLETWVVVLLLVAPIDGFFICWFLVRCLLGLHIFIWIIGQLFWSGFVVRFLGGFSTPLLLCAKLHNLHICHHHPCILLVSIPFP